MSSDPPMDNVFDPIAFGARVKKYRNNFRLHERGCSCVACRHFKYSIRAASSDIGISGATLSRTENGHVPSIEVYFRILKWMEG